MNMPIQTSMPLWLKMSFGLYKIDSPFFSIIIPTLNTEKTLKDCLNSIVFQTFHDYEIFLIDGSSKDSTIDIIKEYSLKYPNIRWVSEKDKGIYDAMNQGIVLSRGKWMFFLGADDVLNDNSVLENIYVADSGSQNVIYGNARITGDTLWAKDGEIYDGKFDLKKLLTKNICHQAIFYKTSFIKKTIGFYNTRYPICSDWDFNLRCWAVTRMHYKDIIVTNFYGGGATTKSNIDDNFSREFIANVLKYFTVKGLMDKLENEDLLKLGIQKSGNKIQTIKKWLTKAAGILK
jgi:glycosyltransferase involved in cell wall biosynthesis